MSADMRAITAQADRIGRHFARSHQVSDNDFHALLHIMVAETAGAPLTLAQLRQRMGVSAAAITYLVDRMIDAGHIRREPDPADRRKALLRYEDSGLALAHTFFSPLGTHLRSAIADLPDKDLAAAHRVFTAMIASMSLFEEELCSLEKAAIAKSGRATTNRRRKAATHRAAQSSKRSGRASAAR
nr:MarR family winged helix-turn-helix transcriptional regulator [Mycobacterium kyorinense]